MLYCCLHPLGSASNQGEQGWMLLVGTPMASVPMTELMIWSQADPSPALGITLVQSHSQTLVVRSTGCLWLFGAESSQPFWLLDAKRANSALMPFVLWDLTQSLLQWKNCFLRAPCQQNVTGVVEWANLCSPVTSQR